MSQITIFLLYTLAATAFAASRLQRFAPRSQVFAAAAYLLAVPGILWHSTLLYQHLSAANGFNVTLAGALSLIGLELALIATIAALKQPLRGVSAGLLVCAALTALLTSGSAVPTAAADMIWQLRMHILLAISAHGLLTVGAIVALFALVQEKRLRAGKLSSLNQLFAPLETNEKLLYSITSAGFLLLATAVVAGSVFIQNLFAQHLTHKAVLSLLALVVFGILLAGHYLAGWRGKRGIYLYLGGYSILLLAYFGSRFILENILGRSWG